MSGHMESILDEDVRAILARPFDWERLSGCRVVVTGAGGFLGNYLARTLLMLYPLGKVSEPIKVVALVRDVARAQTRLAQSLYAAGFELLHWDLNAISVPDLGAVHYVLHAASQASPRYYATDPVGTLLPNTIGTAALLQGLLRSPNPRGFLFVSSSEVYGAGPGDAVLTESSYGVVDPISIRSCYAESKRLGETMCVAWQHQFGVPAFIVRPFHTYGPGLVPEDGRVFADFAFNVLRGENIVMRSDGSARRAFCYVSDAVAGFFAVLLRGQSSLPYNVANPEGELSVLELADLLISLRPHKNLRVERSHHTGESAYPASSYSRVVPDVSRLKALDWRADIGARLGFRRMLDSYE
jgi:UDP-glucuronate decarboxylase